MISISSGVYCARNISGLALLLIFISLTGCARPPHNVHISSEPSGALIFLNDRVIGETPFDTRVEQRKGDYNIYVFKAIKDDCMPAKKAFKEEFYDQTVDDVVPQNIHFSLRQRQKFPVYLTSEPAGAIITVNGDVLGETPLTHYFRERVGIPRTFEIIASLEGFQVQKKVLKEFLPQDNGATFIFPETIHFELGKTTQN